jgi:hypothetical protein
MVKMPLPFDHRVALVAGNVLCPIEEAQYLACGMLERFQRRKTARQVSVSDLMPI